MQILCSFMCLVAVVGIAAPAPTNEIVFPDERRERKLQEIITPPVLPVLPHLERDPSTLLGHENVGKRTSPGQVKPRFGFGGGFNVAPSGNGGLTASVSSSANGGGASQTASQSFSFGFSEGFSASHSASHASSFNGFGSGFSGSQASSQATSFSGNSASGAASSAAAFSGSSGFGGNSGSQSASSAFGFNSLNGFQPESSFSDGTLDIRHRGAPNFQFPTFSGRRQGGQAASFRSRKSDSSPRSNDEYYAILVSN